GGTSRTFQGGARFDVRAGYFTEDRDNGTPFQTNGTTVRQASASAAGNTWGGSWNARAYGASQDYDQTFSAVAADRASERPTTLQHVDSASGAGSFEWLRGGARYAWLLGGSFRQVEADLIERSASAPEAPAVPTPARQRSGAILVQSSFVPSSRVIVGAGVRGEIWRSELRDGTMQRTVVGVFPRASIAWRLDETLTLRAAAHHAFRTPTINELFRPFRVGNVLTGANPALHPEESYGLEGAAFLRRGPGALRVTGFWTRLNDAIVNVTLESTPALILRERQNAGRIRATGVEIEADTRIGPMLGVSAALAYTNSVFTEGAGLEGLSVPQVPRWQGSIGVHGRTSDLSFAADWRVSGPQFDDDRNQFRLDPFTVLNARVGWRLAGAVEVFAAIENAFDEEQDVGRTPIRTIGLPRTARVGLLLGKW
ncbi:MAG TPA: TonB-dependent receptor, partial [Vicinamibacterales bacterium]|nr:TonB-dependent receptor [Vicinamibacterales bacterium]